MFIFYFLNSDCREMMKTGILNMPVRYCASDGISDGLKISWKKKRSTAKNPTMSMMSIIFLMLLFYPSHLHL